MLVKGFDINSEALGDKEYILIGGVTGDMHVESEDTAVFAVVDIDKGEESLRSLVFVNIVFINPWW